MVHESHQYLIKVPKGQSAKMVVAFPSTGGVHLRFVTFKLHEEITIKNLLDLLGIKVNDVSIECNEIPSPILQFIVKVGPCGVSSPKIYEAASRFLDQKQKLGDLESQLGMLSINLDESA